MTYSIHGSHADSLIPQYGTQEQISDAIGGDCDESPDVALLLNDLGNEHALVIEGDEAALRAWHKRVGDVLDEAFPQRPALAQSYEDYLSDEPGQHGIPDGLTAEEYAAFQAQPGHNVQALSTLIHDRNRQQR